MNDLVKEINRLKQEKNAVILAHNYQRPEIYQAADYIGDSLGLSRKAAETDKDLIVFCGVHFMAETAKILNPEKTVLLPAYNAGCPMADMITEDDIAKLRDQYYKAAVACYVNTTAAVKAASDVCVTSANAVDVINSLEQDRIIFVPDRNLASYVDKYTDKEIIPFNGYCHVHDRFSADEIRRIRARFPKASIVVHPECRPAVTSLADYVCSTSKMIDFSRQTNASDIFVGTEMGMLERLKIEVPGKNFYSAGIARVCPNMKRTTLQLVYDALINEQFVIEVPSETAEKAKTSLERMLFGIFGTKIPKNI